MPTLIAVTSCWPNVAAVDAVRRTWTKSSSYPVRFFLGQLKNGKFPRVAEKDEIFVNVPDDYEHHVNKVKAAFQWAREHGFTDVLKCDDDLYVVPDRLRDVIGRYGHLGRQATSQRHPKPFLHGGAGYLIDERSLAILCNAAINDISEDAWATDSLNKVGVKSVSDPRFSYVKRVFGDELPLVPTPTNAQITGGELHTLFGGRSELYQVHRRFLGGNDD